MANMPLLLTTQRVDVVYTTSNSPNPNLFFWSRISQLFALEFGDLMALVATHLSLLPPDPPESCQLDLWQGGTCCSGSLVQRDTLLATRLGGHST